MTHKIRQLIPATPGHVAVFFDDENAEHLFRARVVAWALVDERAEGERGEVEEEETIEPVVAAPKGFGASVASFDAGYLGLESEGDPLEWDEEVAALMNELEAQRRGPKS